MPDRPADRRTDGTAEESGRTEATPSRKFMLPRRGSKQADGRCPHKKQSPACAGPRRHSPVYPLMSVLAVLSALAGLLRLLVGPLLPTPLLRLAGFLLATALLLLARLLLAAALLLVALSA